MSQVILLASRLNFWSKSFQCDVDVKLNLFVLVACIKVVRHIIAVVAAFGYEIHQINVKGALILAPYGKVNIYLERSQKDLCLKAMSGKLVRLISCQIVSAKDQDCGMKSSPKRC